MMQPSLSQQIQDVKTYAQTAWQEGQSLVRLNEQVYPQFLSEMQAI